MRKAILISMIIAVLAIGVGAYNYANATFLDEGFFDNTELTVYNQGLGLVKQQFEVNMDPGESHLLIEGVASQIDTSSVKLTGGIELLEQNYQFDLVNMDQLLEKFIGKDISVIMKDPREEISGKLLSYRNYKAIIQATDGKIYILSANDFILPQLDTSELLLKPTLDWMVYSSDAGLKSLEMMYLTRGISWNADYILELNAEDTAGDLKGWVTINNNAGTTFKDADLKLMAGDVNIIQDNYYPNTRYEGDADYSKSAPGGFSEESMFEYHMYTLGRKTTVRDKEQKQISLLEAENVGVEKRFVYTGGDDVAVKVLFQNKAEFGMGMPLPAGKVKVFKEDSAGALQFLGEDRIDHTPKDEEIELKIGNAFDVVGERKQMNTETGHRWRQYTYDITLRNHKEEDIVVYVEERTSGWTEWDILSETHPSIKDSQKKVYWKIPVEQDGESTLTYTIKYYYRY